MNGSTFFVVSNFSFEPLEIKSCARHEIRDKTMKKSCEIVGLKCPNHDYVKDNHNFMYQEVYPGAQPNKDTRCQRCGYTMSLHKYQK